MKLKLKKFKYSRKQKKLIRFVFIISIIAALVISFYNPWGLIINLGITVLLSLAGDYECKKYDYCLSWGSDGILAGTFVAEFVKAVNEAVNVGSTAQVIMPLIISALMVTWGFIKIKHLDKWQI